MCLILPGCHRTVFLKFALHVQRNRLICSTVLSGIYVCLGSDIPLVSQGLYVHMYLSVYLTMWCTTPLRLHVTSE